MKLKTTSDIVNFLGGNQAVAELLGVSKQAVVNYKATGTFPASSYFLIRNALKKRNRIPPDDLWAMRLPKGGE